MQLPKYGTTNPRTGPTQHLWLKEHPFAQKFTASYFGINNEVRMFASLKYHERKEFCCVLMITVAVLRKDDKDQGLD